MSLALPDKKTALKWTLGICGAIFIGALGSGVWQSLLAPAMDVIGRGMLDFVSLLWTNYKNQIYQQIAADNQSAIPLELLGWVTFACFFLAGMFTGYSQGYIRGLTSTSSSPPFGVGTLRLGMQLSSLLLTVIVIGQLISLEKLSYINSADAHYHYVMRVAAPYLDTQERAEVERNSRRLAAAMTTSSCYRCWKASARLTGGRWLNSIRGDLKEPGVRGDASEFCAGRLCRNKNKSNKGTSLDSEQVGVNLLIAVLGGPEVEGNDGQFVNDRHGVPILR